MIFGIFLNRFWNCWICPERKQDQTSPLSDKGDGVTYLLEVVAELDHGNVIEHPTRVDDQLAMLQRVYVALDQQ